MGEKLRSEAQEALKQRVREEMDRRDWRASDLAVQTGISPSKLSRWFNGQGVEITIDDLYQIAHGFGAEPGDLVPNSSGVTPQIARMLDRLGAFTAAEQFHLIQALDSLIDMRGASIETARVAFGGVGVRGRTNSSRPDIRP